MNVLAPISHLYIHLERAFCGIFLLACKKNLKFYCETWQAILVFTDEVSISITRCFTTGFIIHEVSYFIATMR